MPFKGSNRPIKGVFYENGRTTEEIIRRIVNPYEASGVNPENKRESKMRRDINAFIAEKVMESYPSEEIQIAAEGQFKEESPAKIKRLIEYWEERFKEMIKRIDLIIEKYNKGEISKAHVEKSIWIIYKNFHLFKPYARRYYESRITELEQDER